MARDLENTLTARLTMLLKDDYGLPAETQQVADGKFLDVFIPLEGIRVAIEAKKGDGASRKKAAVKDAVTRLRANHADVAFALVYPTDSDRMSLPTDSISWVILYDPDETTGEWRTGTAEELAKEIRLVPQQVDETNIAARMLSNALDNAVKMLSEKEREFLARQLDLPPQKKQKKKAKGPDELTAHPYDTAAKRGLLVIAIAMLFQIRLQPHLSNERPEGHGGQWPPMVFRACMESETPHGAFDRAWDAILQVDYRPIFETARKALAALTPNSRLIRGLAEAAWECSERTTGNRHDLAGRIFHRVLDTARYDGSYYTSTPAATLLAELAIRPEDACDPLAMHVCDPACGTGTLLMTAANRLRALRPDHIPEDEFNTKLVEDVLYGYDVNLTATHLAATTLGMDSPSTKFTKMSIRRPLLGWWTLDNGRPVPGKSKTSVTYIGSIGFIGGQQPLGLWPSISEHIDDTGERLHQPPQPDLVIMNPPFTRSDLRHDQFTKEEEDDIKRTEQQVLGQTGNIAAAGLFSSSGAFVVLADYMLSTNSGTLAMVLPVAWTSGAGGIPQRKFLGSRFHVDLIVSIHDPKRIFFSENTKVGECLVICRRWDKVKQGEKPPTRVVNLTRNPSTDIEALRLADQIRNSSSGDFTLQEIPSGTITDGDWFATNFLAPVLYEEYRAFQRMDGLVPLDRVATLLPRGGRAIRDYFERSETPTPGGRRALWYHKTDMTRSMTAKTDVYIKAIAGKERQADKRGRLLLPTKLWLPLARVGAVMLDRPSVGSHWVPVHSNDGSEATEDAWALFLNSSVGLLSLLGGRGNRKPSYPDFSINALRSLIVPDWGYFGEAARDQMAAAFKKLKDKTLQPFPGMADDPVRQKIDEVVVDALGLDAERVERVRCTLSEEPSVMNKRYGQ